MSTIVIMPGGFHPFHAGHAALYQSAVKAFPGAEVFVAATNDTSNRPFPFAIKEKLAKLAGVAPGHFVQVKSPFRAEEITAQFDPARDRLIFVRSEKDAGKPPQAGGNKKDGNPAYLQPLAGQTNIAPFSKHAYMAYLPTVEFGPGMTSATEIRTAWPTLNEKRKTALVMSLYPATQKNPKLAANVVKLLDTAIGGGLDEDLSRRGFLKGAGAAAAGAAGLAPEKAQSNILIPILQGLLGSDIPRPDIACAPRGVKVGQKVFWRGEQQQIIQIYGEHRYCKNPDLPIAVKIGKLDPVQEPIVQQPPKQPATKNYAERLRARIKPNIVYQGDMSENYQAEVEIKVSPDGVIIGSSIIKSSGNPEWDSAVIKAVKKTERLPLDVDGNIPSIIVAEFNTLDGRELEQRRREQLQRMQQGAGATGPARESVEQGVAEMDGQNFVGGMTASYQAQENQPIDEDYIDEKWSQKYKSSINCANPKGFSQRAHCAGRKK